MLLRKLCHFVASLIDLTFYDPRRDLIGSANIYVGPNPLNCYLFPIKILQQTSVMSNTVSNSINFSHPDIVRHSFRLCRSLMTDENANDWKIASQLGYDLWVTSLSVTSCTCAEALFASLRRKSSWLKLWQRLSPHVSSLKTSFESDSTTAICSALQKSWLR